MEQIQGHIIEVVYNNPMDGFTVMMVQEPNEEDPSKVVGYFCPVYLHERILVKGIWENHAIHGRQLINKRYELSLPNTQEHIHGYLLNGAISVLSRTDCKLLFETYADETLRVIVGNPNLLISSTSFTKRKVQSIKKAVSYLAEIRELSNYLLSNGIKPGYANPIYAFFKEGYFEQIKHNPYQLCQEFIAIPFPDVDRLALRAGFEESSDSRIRAALDYVMHIEEQKGFFYVDYLILIQQCQVFTSLDDKQIKTSLDRMITQSQFILQQRSDHHFIVCSQRVHKRIGRIFETLHKLSVNPLDQTLYINLIDDSKIPHEYDIQLLDDHIGPEKVTIIDTNVDSEHLLKHLDQVLTDHFIPYIWFDKLDRPKDFYTILSYNKMTSVYEKNAIARLKEQCIIISNSHILSFDDFYAITEALDPSSQLIMIGDGMMKQRDTHGSIFKHLKNLRYCHRLNLSTIPDKKDLIVYNATSLAKSNPLSLKIRSDGNFFMIKEEAPHRIIDQIHDLIDRRLPKAYGFHKVKDIQICTPSVSGNLGAKRLNNRLRDLILKKKLEEFPFSSGDKVYQRFDDHSKGIYSGEIGVVSKVNLDQQQVTVHFHEKKAIYQYSEVTALDMAYAIPLDPIHLPKLKCSIIPIHSSMGKKLTKAYLYNVMMRTNDLCILVGSDDHLDQLRREEISPSEFNITPYSEAVYNPSGLPPIRILASPLLDA